MSVLLVIVGGAVGAPLRYLVDQWVRSRRRGAFPLGTLAVNVTGSLLLGFLAAATAGGVLPAWALTLVGTGVCGALTTFSTFGLDTVSLLEAGAWRPALLNVAGSLAAGLAACAAGFAAGSAL